MLWDPFRNVRVAAARQLVATLDTNSPAGRDCLNFLAHGADQPLGQLQIADFEWKCGDITNSLVHFEKAVKWDPYSPGVRHELAVALSQLGRTKDAVQQMEEAVKLAPNEAEFHYDLALALNDARDTDRVISELETAVKLNTQSARAWYNLGLARNAPGNTAGALLALQTAAGADPHDAQIPYARAAILAQLGRVDEARVAARQALELNPRFREAARCCRHFQPD
jgi:Flp pilus assembly protein TadD